MIDLYTAGTPNGWKASIMLEECELPYEAQRRVAVTGTVAGSTRDGTSWRLEVVSGHLDTRSRWSRLLDSFGAGRTRQARALAEAARGESVVLGADLNTWSLGLLEGALDVLRERFPVAAHGFDGATYVAAGVIPRRLDHLLFRLPEGWEARVARVDDRYGSDHYPLLGVVRIGGAKAQ